MGLGIVSLASAVGVNREIVDDERDGFLVPSADGWLEAVERVLGRAAEFGAIGAAAREKVRSRYSFEAHKSTYLAFMSRC
jgi:glycosyltransferase involved in cell wall biosynthesis